MGEPMVTRTRQDLINSGDAFKMRGAFSPSTNGSQDFRGSSASNDNSHINNTNYNKPNSKRKVNECCYSISNLVLIIASIIALIVLIKFVQDDALYEYGEFLLSLNFYRKITYTICLCVLLPLILLIPTFNALSVFLLSDKHKHGQVGETILRVKLFYHAIMFVLVLVALIVVAPYIRTANLSAQIELELRRHMNYRYQNEFSLEFLDTIQETYECCDELWYRSHLDDQLPLSCFIPGSNLGRVYTQTCSQAISSLVSVRCSIVAACLFAILLALASLFAIDLLDLLSINSSRHHYKISSTNSLWNGPPGSDTASSHLGQRTGSFKRRDEDHLQQHHQSQPAIGEDNDDGDDRGNSGNAGANGGDDRRSQSPIRFVDRHTDDECEALTVPKTPLPSAATATSYASGANRLREGERQREVPLLAAGDDRKWKGRPASDKTFKSYEPNLFSNFNKSPPAQLPSQLSSSTVEMVSSGSNLSEHVVSRRPASGSEQDPILLARANYQQVQRERSQSPVFRTIVDEYVDGQKADSGRSASSSKPPVATKPIKSALKKTSSNQHLDSGTSTGSARRRASQDASDSADDDDRGSGRVGPRDTSGSLSRQDFEDVDADADSLDEYAEKLRQSTSLLRQEPTRRSLLSVRFAE